MLSAVGAVHGPGAQLRGTGSSLQEETAKLNILYLETALEQINATALLPDKILFQVPVVLMAFSSCFDSSVGSFPKKKKRHIGISQTFFCTERQQQVLLCGKGMCALQKVNKKINIL